MDLGLARGAAVVIVARDAARQQTAALELAHESGGRVDAVPADIDDRENVAAMGVAVQTRFGRIDILVN